MKILLYMTCNFTLSNLNQSCLKHFYSTNSVIQGKAISRERREIDRYRFDHANFNS